MERVFGGGGVASGGCGFGSVEMHLGDEPGRAATREVGGERRRRVWG